VRRFLRRSLKPATFAAALIPLGKIGYDAFLGEGLGANPIADVLNHLGFWTLTMLTITLACTPAKILLGITWPLRIRRMLGLFTFFYALLHFTTYFALDQFFDLGAIYEDVVRRKFITIGFAGFLLLIPLAVTSTDRAVRRLGFRRWKRLHRLVYVVAGLGLIHFIWRVKADLRTPLTFTAIILGLMAVRLAAWVRSRRRARRTGSGSLRLERLRDKQAPTGGVG
jgi:sulfoxide reductase heme-binding subunit YedZ